MGVAKLLLPWGESTVIEQVLAAWRESCLAETLVVVHPDDLRLADVCRHAGATVIVPPEEPAEMKDSVRYALDVLRNRPGPPISGWLLAPADVPTLSAATINRVVQAYGAQPGRIVIPYHAGRRGHPVLFPWSLAAEVDTLPADKGLNYLLDRHPVEELPLGETAVPEDIDTPADYARLRNRHERHNPDH